MRKKINKQAINISVFYREKLYSLDDIIKILDFLNENYYKIENELAKPYEDKGEDVPDDFFDIVDNTCYKRAIESIK